MGDRSEEAPTVVQGRDDHNVGQDGGDGDVERQTVWGLARGENQEHLLKAGCDGFAEGEFLTFL